MADEGKNEDHSDSLPIDSSVIRTSRGSPPGSQNSNSPPTQKSSVSTSVELEILEEKNLAQPSEASNSEALKGNNIGAGKTPEDIGDSGCHISGANITTTISPAIIPILTTSPTSGAFFQPKILSPTDKEPCILKAKRKLWDVNPIEVDAALDKEYKRLRKEESVIKSAKWNFDFEREVPLEGEWRWQQEQHTPSFYKQKELHPLKPPPKVGASTPDKGECSTSSAAGTSKQADSPEPSSHSASKLFYPIQEKESATVSSTSTNRPSGCSSTSESTSYPAARISSTSNPLNSSSSDIISSSSSTTECPSRPTTSSPTQISTSNPPTSRSSPTISTSTFYPSGSLAVRTTSSDVSTEDNSPSPPPVLTSSRRRLKRPSNGSSAVPTTTNTSPSWVKHFR